MALTFEWDPAKARANLRKHGVSFSEAASAFADVLSLTINDADHSTEEERRALLGMARSGRLLVVVHVERSHDRIRLISARRATRGERRDYEES